jgi:SMC interacting uncharacterized protein involved in chromosome segregation
MRAHKEHDMADDEFPPLPDPMIRWKADAERSERERARGRVRLKLAENRERQAVQQSAQMRDLEQRLNFALEQIAGIAQAAESALTGLDSKIAKLERVLTKSELESQKMFTDLFARLDSVRQDLQQSPKPQAHALRAVN